MVCFYFFIILKLELLNSLVSIKDRKLFKGEYALAYTAQPVGILVTNSYYDVDTPYTFSTRSTMTFR